MLVSALKNIKWRQSGLRGSSAQEVGAGLSE